MALVGTRASTTILDNLHRSAELLLPPIPNNRLRTVHSAPLNCYCAHPAERSLHASRNVVPAHLERWRRTHRADQRLKPMSSLPVAVDEHEVVRSEYRRAATATVGVLVGNRTQER